ncbi:hypothetical protein [Sphingomonas sp.]|uniref:hypothetical protein n=1 Tax=Sphingomonas sp. TaxID=28214 RepID=UPI0035B49242
MEGGLWGTVVILGPILLALAIGWAMLRNRTSKAKLRQTEQATRDLYDDQSAADRTRP